MKHEPEVHSHYDAVVVGNRVAGASTAMLLARAGLRVLALDKSPYGSDTLSTHALMRAGVMQLYRWGVLEQLVAAGTPAIRRTTFHYGREAIDVDIKDRDGVNALFAPRRTVLDVVLADAAAAAGVHTRFKATVKEIVHDDSGRVRGVSFTDQAGVTRSVKADIVIGADGARSAVARAVQSPVLHVGHRPGAYIYSYWRGLPFESTHWYYGAGVAAGVIPTNDGLTCVFIGMPQDRYVAMRHADQDRLFHQVARECDPDLDLWLGRAVRQGKLYSFAGREGYIRQCWGQGWALVGDAGCFKDPLTAHGITDALRDAELLARAVTASSPGALAEYQAERDSFAVEFLQLSDQIASFDWDMDSVKVLHHRLSKLMNRECDRVRDFDSVASTRESMAA